MSAHPLWEAALVFTSLRADGWVVLVIAGAYDSKLCVQSLREQRHPEESVGERRWKREGERAARKGVGGNRLPMQQVRRGLENNLLAD